MYDFTVSPALVYRGLLKGNGHVVPPHTMPSSESAAALGLRTQLALLSAAQLAMSENRT